MSSSSSRPAKVLSCASCRQRKIKCDKTQPACAQCARFGLECVFPARKPTRRAPRPRQSELLHRISRLETIVGQADPEKLRRLDDADADADADALLPLPAGSASTAAATATAAATTTAATTKPRSPSPGHPQDRYLGAEFWGNLCAEVEGIKQALDQPSDDEDDDVDDEGSPESCYGSASTTMAPSGFILGNPSYSLHEPLVHPPPDMMLRLWGIYLRHVDPMMKILHRPTMTKRLHTFVEDPLSNALGPHTKALVFAIYFSAATCLSPDACLKQLGESSDVVAARYRLAVERALAEADYLNSNELETLQAFALYTAMMRVHCRDRTCWALTALLVRLAQAQELHRDGDGHRFTPFTAEMRRRLWNFILVLDIRGSEDRGSDALLTRDSHTTVPPTAIDDDAFGPTSPGPLVAKTTGPADNVISMCTAMCSTIFGYLTHPHASDAEGVSRRFMTEDDIIQHVRCLERSFIHTADRQHLPSLYASEIARIVILKLWLNIQYPHSAAPPPVERPRVSRSTMLRTAVSVMELSERMGAHEWHGLYDWWTDTYVQWHPLAVALAELCVQTDGDLVRHAWAVVDRFLPHMRSNIADTARGSLWRPIKKLLKKAREARAKALMKNMPPPEPLPAVPQVPAQDELQEQLMRTMTLREPMPATATTQEQRLYDSMTMDPSYLFEYPPELLNQVDFDPQVGLDNTIPMEWATWTEFLQDTQMSNSPEGSGGGDSI